MRVLLDECLPRKLKSELAEHEVRTAQEEGWAGLKNGALLQVASSQFDVLLTVDRGLAFQQNLQGLRIGVVAMVAKSNRFRDLRPLVVQVRQALSRAKPGEVLRVGGYLRHSGDGGRASIPPWVLVVTAARPPRMTRALGRQT